MALVFVLPWLPALLASAGLVALARARPRAAIGMGVASVLSLSAPLLVIARGFFDVTGEDASMRATAHAQTLSELLGGAPQAMAGAGLGLAVAFFARRRLRAGV